ncbi:hypothetical protein Tco_0857778 [Tanacetum coccineum]|uniref:Reverse transcriptase n=1 Tax=Tanacetum coccineum TaxID=301880 RepID=A0ABQ5B843_9ASTR
MFGIHMIKAIRLTYDRSPLTNYNNKVMVLPWKDILLHSLLQISYALPSLDDMDFHCCYSCEILLPSRGSANVVDDASVLKDKSEAVQGRDVTAELLRMALTILNGNEEMERLKAARDRQKSYADNRRKPLEFKDGDKVLLKVSLERLLVFVLGRKGKLALRYVGPFRDSG